MSSVIEGRVRKFGDDVNTDYIISSRRKRETIDESVLRRYLLEGVDPDFAASVRSGDVLVAGRNFGCGSAMEVAVTVILFAGIPAVLARSFARSFYRNAINNGLLAIECDTTGMREGERLVIAVDDGAISVTREDQAGRVAIAPMPPLVVEIVKCGGLVPYLREHGGFAVGRPSGEP